MIGAGLYLRTGPQVESVLARLAGESGTVGAELTRMTRVQRNFLIIQFVELVVIITAAIVAMSFKHRVSTNSVALGLLCHAAFLFAFDIIVERRGAAYISVLWIEYRKTAFLPTAQPR